MALGQLSREAVEQAVAEYDEIGRDAFLSKYGFGPATTYTLVIDGREYDPKAIAGVAYGFDHPDEGPLKANDFSGGLELRSAYRPAGFDVVLRTQPGVRVIADLMQGFLETYIASRSEPFGAGSDAFARMRALESTLGESGPVASRPNIKVKASVGTGNWAAAPWVAFLDDRETTTTLRGVYPVFLFREDMSGVYLTVAQGTTDLRNQFGKPGMLARLAQTADKVRGLVTPEQRGAGLVLDSDVTLGQGQLAKNYEASTIVHKLYEAGAVPDDDVILNDLEVVLGINDAYVDRSNAQTPGPSNVADVSLSQIADAFREAVDQSGLRVPTGHGDRVKALIAALKTKPFVILTGLSGSGKTQLALRLGEWFGTGPRGRRFLPVPVRPDWTGPEALFGYEDALRPAVGGQAAWFVPSTLEFLLQAEAEPDMPYLLLLDEMNLAHVERYFSDFLSGVESREAVLPNLARGADGEWRQVAGGPTRIPLPRNLFVIGTVNVDETTYQFSPKVLDRATTFEVSTATAELTDDVARPRPVPPASAVLLQALAGAVLDDAPAVATAASTEVAEALRGLHRRLTVSDDEFGFRVFHESRRLASALEQLGVTTPTALLDHIVLLKVLPRIHGSRRRAEPVLNRLAAFAQSPDGPETFDASLSVDLAALPMTSRKLRRMMRAVQINQFVSFTD